MAKNFQKIILVAAMSKNRVIGKGNRLPWDMPADLAFFKKVTQGKPIIMGRKTFDSIGRPLPNRRNIVITRSPDWSAQGCEVVNDIESALKTARVGKTDIMVIGGEMIFRKAMPFATHIYLTVIHTEIEAGDAYFPEYDPSVWREISRQDFKADNANPYDYSFLVLEKKERSKKD